MPKATAVHDGIAYCQTCYKRIFRPVPCQKCGKTVRTPNGTAPALCRKCKTVGRHCVRCGKDVPQAALIVENGVACPSCARFFKELQPCPACGRMTVYLSRDVKNGFSEPVCEQCRRKDHRTCPSCGKYRSLVGLTSDGRLVCRTCLATDGKPFLCPKCGKEGKRHSSTRCETCYWRERTEKKLKNALFLLEHEWVRKAFFDFIAVLSEKSDPKDIGFRLERYFLFFSRLDVLFRTPEEATCRGMVAAFGREGLRRYAAAFGFLVKSGRIPRQSASEIEKESLIADQKRMLRACEDRWYHGLFGSFLENQNKVGQMYADRGWTGKRQRYGSRTILVTQRAAAKFLQSLDPGMVKSVQQIEQVHIDRFLLQRPGYRSSMRPFVRYLNRTQKLFKKLKIEHVRQNLPPDIFIDRANYVKMLREWLTPPDDSVKEALIGLLMLLYAQRAKHLVRLRLSDISHGRDGVYRVVFGRTQIALDRRVGSLLDRYLPARKALAAVEEPWENDYLFPGKMAEGHLTEAAVSYYLKKRGVTADQVFATSILYAYLSGLKHPKVLVKAFGINDCTAIKYLNLINPRLRDEVEMRLNDDV
jgi:site-specific recombinase XerD